MNDSPLAIERLPVYEQGGPFKTPAISKDQLDQIARQADTSDGCRESIIRDSQLVRAELESALKSAHSQLSKVIPVKRMCEDSSQARWLRHFPEGNNGNFIQNGQWSIIEPQKQS